MKLQHGHQAAHRDRDQQCHPCHDTHQAAQPAAPTGPCASRKRQEVAHYVEPIAHSPLVFAVTAGVNYASGINDGTLLGVLGINKWRMTVPVKHGDTIHVESQVLASRESGSRKDAGIVTFACKFVNQRCEAVQEMEITILYRRRPTG